jgi:hypothetical protein
MAVNTGELTEDGANIPVPCWDWESHRREDQGRRKAGSELDMGSSYKERGPKRY